LGYAGVRVRQPESIVCGILLLLLLLLKM